MRRRNPISQTREPETIIGAMSTLFDDLARRARELSPQEKAALARALIDDLDSVSDAGVEQMWIEEARRRYDAYRSGDFAAVPGDEAMARARSRVK